MKREFVLALFVLRYFNYMHANDPWTWHYKKIFSDTERIKNQSKTEMQFEKINIPSFSQMIVSWNARRPDIGLFTLWGQVRDAKTKKWHDWHKMFQWGAHSQRSFFSEREDTIYHHVRLEIPTHDLSDGLRIKVVADHDATIGDLHALFVCISDYTKFKNELTDNLSHLPSVKINNVPQVSQMELVHEKKEVLCSPTSCSILMSYLLGKSINPVDFATRCYDDGLQAYGSWPYNLAHAYELGESKFLFKVVRLNSFHELHESLVKKIPVVVSVRGLLKDAPQEYKLGHLLVVIGWNNRDRKVICIDPAFDQHEKTLIEYDAASFIAAWERSRRLAYMTMPLS